jgi:hypothetical protein
MVVSRDVYRLQIRALDSCLSRLEEAHEQDELVVSADLAARLERHVPLIAQAMLIADAIELVFQEQERLRAAATDASGALVHTSAAGFRTSGNGRIALADDWTELNPEESSGDQPIDVMRARGLTEQIRSATRVVCLLLLQAYEQRIWFALEYRSWEEYVRHELGFRRSRAYEFLEQARVIRALQVAADTSAVPDISAYMAEQIKPYLDRVVAIVRSRTVGKPRERAVEIIVDVVRQQRLLAINSGTALAGRAGGERPGDVHVVERPEDSVVATLPATDQSSVPGSLGHLFDVIDYLAELPPIDDVTLDAMGRDDIRADELDRAVRWLGEFEERCRDWWRTCGQSPALDARAHLRGDCPV